MKEQAVVMMHEQSCMLAHMLKLYCSGLSCCQRTNTGMPRCSEHCCAHTAGMSKRHLSLKCNRSSLEVQCMQTPIWQMKILRQGRAIPAGQPVMPMPAQATALPKPQKGSKGPEASLLKAAWLPISTIGLILTLASLCSRLNLSNQNGRALQPAGMMTQVQVMLSQHTTPQAHLAGMQRQ